MAKYLQLALWKSNSLTKHTEELKTFISIHNTIVTLISEMHFPEESYLKLSKYTAYYTNYPAGTATIIQNSIKHHQLNNYSQDFLQATSVSAEHAVKQEKLEDFHNTLGHRFITGGDYNAKHTDWGSTLITPRGAKYSKHWKETT
jgi:hypothetical protein